MWVEIIFDIGYAEFNKICVLIDYYLLPLLYEYLLDFIGVIKYEGFIRAHFKYYHDMLYLFFKSYTYFAHPEDEQFPIYDFFLHLHIW